jgi:hypothetical protein
LRTLDHTTDSGSLAGSESIVTKSSGGTRAATSRAAASQASTTVTARTTASHHIASKAGKLIKNKGNLKGSNGKLKETAPEPDLSDEDDSREREAALSSPIKGKISRELNKVRIYFSP